MAKRPIAFISSEGKDKEQLKKEAKEAVEKFMNDYDTTHEYDFTYDDDDAHECDDRYDYYTEFKVIITLLFIIIAVLLLK